MEFDDVRKLSSFLVKLKQLEDKSYKTQDPIENHEDQNVQTSRSWSQKEKEMHYLQKCLRENQNCHSLLNLIESSINLLLESCVKEQKIINAKLNECMRKGGKNSFYKTGTPHLRKMLGKPYFKTERGFSHPHNEDVSKRNVQGFLNQCNVSVPLPWNEHEKSAITQYIRKVEEEKWIQTLASCGMLHMANIKQMSLEELVESRYDEYDWLNISVSILENGHSPEECRVMWFTCLHPQINQQIWSEKENKKLIILVKQHGGQDWDGIAQELGTKRTGFQCIRHFKVKLSQMNKSEWTKSEIASLKTWVKIFHCKQFVPWYNVKKFMNGRSLYEIYRVWKKINNIEGKPGTFSLEEDVVLVAGMRMFGCDYIRIQEHLPHRTLKQVRKRTEILKCRQFPKQAWSAEEDTLLRNWVDKYGFGNWVKLSMHFVNRSPSAVRNRWETLQKHKSNKSCPSTAIRNPMYSTDIVNITLLWESVVKICQENKICDSMDNLEEKQSVNVIHKLSQLLKPKMRLQRRTVAERKLRPFLDREYYKFFQGAYLQNENKNITDCRKIIHSSAYDIIIALKLLEAKIQVPVIKKVETDIALSSHDKCIVRYLVDKVSEISECSEIFLAHTVDKQNIISGENPSISSDNICHVFPPNLSSLIAMRSLLLNNQNLKQQKEGLTMQLDNIELKELNTLCSPRELHFGENHNVAGKLWNERMDKLLGGVALILNKECEGLQF